MFPRVFTFSVALFIQIRGSMGVYEKSAMTVNIRSNDYPLRAKKKHQCDTECAKQEMIKALLVSVWAT